MGSQIDFGDQPFTSWVNGGVGAVGELIDVWGSHILIVSAEPVVDTFSESVSATVEVGCWWTENVGLDPDGWAGVPCTRAGGGAWEDFTDERRRGGET